MYGTLTVPQKQSGTRRMRVAGFAATILVGCACVCLAVALSDSSNSIPTILSFGGESLGDRARTDIDPGSLKGLEQAAYAGSSDGLSFGRRRDRAARLGRETEAGELEQLQEKETTQADRARSDHDAPMLRASLGKTIAKYFTTVRSVKDDQGTFLG